MVVGALVAGPSGLLHPVSSGAVSPGFSIVTLPALDQAFNPTVLDYTVRCTGATTTTVQTAGSDVVSIGGTVLPGPADASVPLVAGQGVAITDGGTTYHVRCLPSDFPTYTASVTGTPQQANGYFLTLGGYAIVFDTDGVPVWWLKDSTSHSPFDAKFLDPTTVAYWDGANEYQLRGLDGSLQGTVGGGSLPIDLHDLQRLPDGNYLAIQNYTRNCPADPTQCVDLSSWGLSSQEAIFDDVIVELNPQNQVVWSWDVADHIDVATADVNWHNLFPDVIHMNSIQYDGNGGIIFSARHLDAVYRIDMATGVVTWKLGGSLTPESLTVSGDPYVDAGGQLFSGQHYARLLPDGSLTVHDNGFLANRQPRAVHFTIDPNAMTATEIGQVSDPRTAAALCCGSAELLSGGDWVVDWGYNDFTTELNAEGVPQITITYPGTFSYRSGDVLATVDAMRQGMDAMVPPAVNVTTPFGVAIGGLPPATRGSRYGPVTLRAVNLGISASPHTTTLRWDKGVVVAPATALPQGMTLFPNGVLSGTPSKNLAGGRSQVVVKVTEAVTTLTSKGRPITTRTTVQVAIPLTIN